MFNNRNALFNSFDLFNDNNLMRADVYESNGNYTIDIDLPGFRKEDILIDYNSGYISVTAIKNDAEQENQNYIRRERFYGEYNRSFYVGDIDEASIKANYENGILKLTFMEKENKNNSRNIVIE